MKYKIVFTNPNSNDGTRITETFDNVEVYVDHGCLIISQFDDEEEDEEEGDEDSEDEDEDEDVDVEDEEGEEGEGGEDDDGDDDVDGDIVMILSPGNWFSARKVV